jgi:hypothetical protein
MEATWALMKTNKAKGADHSPLAWAIGIAR